MSCIDDSELEKLHQRFRQLSQKAHYCRRTLIEDVFLHSFSREKLRCAAWSALRRGRCSFELRNDVMQDATLAVMQAFRFRPPSYRDKGAESFGRWLWLLWYRACRRAINRVQRERATALEDLDVPCCESAPELGLMKSMSRRGAWEDVLFHISQIDDCSVRLVLSDWAAGLTGAESARLRAIPAWTMSRLRQRGVTYLRRKLRDE